MIHGIGHESEFQILITTSTPRKPVYGWAMWPTARPRQSGSCEGYLPVSKRAAVRQFASAVTARARYWHSDRRQLRAGGRRDC